MGHIRIERTPTTTVGLHPLPIDSEAVVLSGISCVAQPNEECANEVLLWCVTMDLEMAARTVEVNLVWLDAHTGVGEEVLVPALLYVLDQLLRDGEFRSRYLSGIANILVHLRHLLLYVSVSRHRRTRIPFLQDFADRAIYGRFLAWVYQSFALTARETDDDFKWLRETTTGHRAAVACADGF
ncbi:hypothetical protein A0H81_07210 [Grifola frondosa]|uniref:Uncharacterized protein n=1 Tax=Grifola frondosa TaxID=5627 RepID=A0A1C7M924_GRIFR|nr:hypothetical protein A0H81_07210 [Grifola frondosa]